MNKGHNLVMALRAAYLSMHRQTNAHLAAVGVTADQFVCLALLAEEDGITQQELVRRATSDPNTIRAMLMLLEKRGLVKRERHPTDGRARHVTLTPRGRAVYRRSMEELKEVQDVLKAQIPSGAEKILMRYFESIPAHLSA
ncbi:MarR family transcriptional regulator [bacterium]|nr:MarR family transcriptional regulator [bacterium]